MIDIPPIPHPVPSLADEISAMQPQFSIITATYNSGDLFDRTAASLRAQTCCNLEWIVVDGASKDDTVARIEAQGDQVSRWISEKDRGISDAWNKGLAMATGRYVLFLNAGDTYAPEFLQHILDLDDRDERIVCSHARLLSETGQPIGVFRSQPEKLYRAMHLAHNWCAVPRTHYERLGGYVEIPLAMDFEWFHRYFLERGVQGFAVIDAALGDYHLGGKSDVNYAASFHTNEKILVHHGSPRPIAMFWRLAYTAKHAWRTRKMQEQSR